MAIEVPTLDMHKALTDRLERLEKTLDKFLSRRSLPTFLTRNQAKDVLGISMRTLDTLIKNGSIETRREGPRHGKVLVSVESIEKRLLNKGFVRTHIETQLKQILNGE